MSINKEKLADFTDKVNPIVKGLGALASIFLPKASVPIVLASEVLDEISKIDDKDAETVVLGLTATSEALNDIANRAKEGQPIDYKQLELLSDNLKVIDKSLDKFYKVIS
ncbi:hypothetical protein [Campylobacter sp. RM16187]|uniref:hypothetical protein n=1 Tax=Campylobacter sp. RM16187 TaxID=1660063 RepID=UPI0021B6317C|nr:hypothetical protein [Campylobacter sp. RM16187]QKG28774.1 hypothetical protein CDOMF_0492 [Campylobacter sp. RM16187]